MQATKRESGPRFKYDIASLKAKFYTSTLMDFFKILRIFRMHHKYYINIWYHTTFYLNLQWHYFYQFVHLFTGKLPLHKWRCCWYHIKNENIFYNNYLKYNLHIQSSGAHLEVFVWRLPVYSENDHFGKMAKIVFAPNSFYYRPPEQPQYDAK